MQILLTLLPGLLLAHQAEKGLCLNLCLNHSKCDYDLLSVRLGGVCEQDKFGPTRLIPRDSPDPGNRPCSSSWRSICQVHVLGRSWASSQDIALAYQQLLQQLLHPHAEASQHVLFSSASDSSGDGHDSSADSQHQHLHSQQARHFHAQPEQLDFPDVNRLQWEGPDRQLPSHLPEQLPQRPWTQHEQPSAQSSEPNTAEFQRESHAVQDTAQPNLPRGKHEDHQLPLQLQQQVQREPRDPAVGTLQAVQLDERLEAVVGRIGREAFQNVIKRRDVEPAWAITEAMCQVCPHYANEKF